jgi:phage tail protein X
MQTYIATKGDTWDSIAYKVYGDEFFCDTVCAANSRKHEGVIVFEGGEQIDLPEVVSTQLNVIKAPWET